MENKERIAILGGGLSGLTVGYMLSQKGWNVEILEKESECGGLMRSVQENGFTFDIGGTHVIFSKDEEVLNFMLNLLGDNKIKNKRNAKILYKGRYIKYPFENGLADLPKEENFECLYYFIINLIKKEKGEIKPPKNLKEWFYYTLGKGIAEKYLIPYNEKIWKYPLEDISIEWVERIPNPSIEDVIKSSLGIETEGYTHQLYFYYPKKGGIQALIRSLESKIKGIIIRNFEIKKIRKENGVWIVSNGKEERIYDRIISTIPIFDLVNAVNPEKEIREVVKKLKYNSLITVMIGVDTPKLNDFSWLYIPDRNVLPHRVSFPSNFSPYVAPKGKSSVLAEITCRPLDEIWRMKDEKILDEVIEQLHELKIINKNKVCYQNVKRLKYAYIIYDLEYKKNIEIVRKYFKKIGIDLIGRFSEFEYMNMDACIRHAIDFVRRFEHA